MEHDSAKNLKRQESSSYKNILPKKSNCTLHTMATPSSPPFDRHAIEPLLPSPEPKSDFGMGRMAKARSQLPEQKSAFGMVRARPESPEPKSAFGMVGARPKSPERKSAFGMVRARPESPEPAPAIAISRVRPEPPEPKSAFGMVRARPKSPEPKSAFGMLRARPKSPEPKSAFGMSRARSQPPEPESGKRRTRSPSAVGSSSELPREPHIASSETPDMLLTLVYAGYVWGRRASSPIESEQQGCPSTVGEGEHTHELVCPPVPHIGMAVD